MRLFTGIDLPPSVVGSLVRLLEQLRPKARVRWSPPENLHITTKFIGEWPEERLHELKAALAALPPRPPLHIAIRKLGFFPNPHSPRVLWAGIDGGPGLSAVADETDRALAMLGIAREERAFSPHLTLARIKDPVPMQPLREAIAALPSVEFGEFSVDRFYLYLSRMQAGGSVYTKLSEFLLPKE